jgi:hypothetical protein
MVTEYHSYKSMKTHEGMQTLGSIRPFILYSTKMPRVLAEVLPTNSIH